MARAGQNLKPSQIPVDFTTFPVYRDDEVFSGIFPENPVGLACMQYWIDPLVLICNGKHQAKDKYILTFYVRNFS